MNPDEMDNVTPEQPTDGGEEQPTDDGGEEQPTDDGGEEQPTDDGGDNGAISPEISIADASIVEGNEGNSSLEFTVSLSQSIDQATTITYATGDLDSNQVPGTATGLTDYIPISDSLTFQPGETSQTISVDIVGDTVDEEDETFFVTIGNDGGVAIADREATGTIINDDGDDGAVSSEISISDAAIVEGNEGNTALEFTVSLSEAIEEETTVDFSTFDESAVAGEDYVSASGSLTFAPGETTKTISVDLIGDTVEESDETFIVGLSNAFPVAIANLEATGTIINDDGEDSTSNITADLSADVTSIPEGDDGETSVITYTVNLSEPVPDQSVRGIIDISSSDSSNSLDGFVFDDGADEGLDIAPGETTGTFTYTFSGDNVEEPDETIDVSLGFVGLMDDGSGNGRNETFNFGQSSVSTIILDDDGNNANRPTISVTSDLGDSVPEGDEGDTSSLDYTISLDNPAERDITVDLGFNRTGNGQNVSFDDSVTISAGQESVTYTAGDISGDNVEEEDESTTITLQNATYADGGDGEIVISDVQSSATITVLDDDGENTGDGSNIVYRFFNPTAGVHFYTDNEVERDFVEDELDNYEFEGASYRTVDPLSGQADDVYRFFNASTGVHLYTTDENERDSIIENLDDFTFEGSAYSAYKTQIEGTIPIYRFYEPSIGVHFYTPNEAERDVVDTELDNYNNEGIAFYASPLNAEDL